MTQVLIWSKQMHLLSVTDFTQIQAYLTWKKHLFDKNTILFDGKKTLIY